MAVGLLPVFMVTWGVAAITNTFNVLSHRDTTTANAAPRRALFMVDPADQSQDLQADDQQQLIGGTAWPRTGLQVAASPEAANDTALFRHEKWGARDLVGFLGGYLGVNQYGDNNKRDSNANGIMGGNFSVADNTTTPAVTGQWISVDETAAPHKQAAFHLLAGMLAMEMEQGAGSLERILDGIAKVFEEVVAKNVTGKC
ncbi:hypothetical protein LTR36_009873 [Oleoguttula mirabilis]|uniref:Uncharacterized protein n=1 Tax=Oleoguttula mirabilis TaxID=1507867 RepID=A0AAV9J504_9PEZI|nr:hypothetical protein LTR36_009873 [Oleoguttula mirabilis]